MTIAGARRRRRFVLGDAALTAWGLLGLAFLFFPIVVIVVFSFNSGRTLQAFEGFSLQPYLDALANPAITNAISVSLVTAAGTAVVSTVLGTLAGIALTRRPGWWAPALLVLLGLVMVTPEIVSAISLLPWFVSLGTDWGVAFFNVGQVRLIVANSLFASAVVTFIVRARMAGMNEALEEAAADLYATPLRRFTDITLPLISPAVISGHCWHSLSASTTPWCPHSCRWPAPRRGRCTSSPRSKRPCGRRLPRCRP
ncbi:ABC transporter permease [Mycolicibacterium tokaiense]|uniref:Binding-protein-dependent transport system inner membrane protein n=1 Tax=Mycolicibacterium tokaiense TaxID=39695 RepID=A0A378THX1_9MYCO|nr:ABC transporter permease subunit [Mycolicibacterium tokaiense]STZ59757.1 binding-protein-dependent transport system inner membrane protein [Mycolicibacterium tokaiense]